MEQNLIWNQLKILVPHNGTGKALNLVFRSPRRRLVLRLTASSAPRAAFSAPDVGDGCRAAVSRTAPVRRMCRGTCSVELAQEHHEAELHATPLCHLRRSAAVAGWLRPLAFIVSGNFAFSRKIWGGWGFLTSSLSLGMTLSTSSVSSLPSSQL